MTDAVRTGRADDPYDLSRFLAAQGERYRQALSELRAGNKTGHWMWFVFPQMLGLGKTKTAVTYSIRSSDEASAYLHHPVLGPRLIECAQALLSVHGKTALQIFGDPDHLKLRSSATLFAQVSAPGSVFHQLLDRYYDGRPDEQTLTLLRPGPP